MKNGTSQAERFITLELGDTFVLRTVMPSASLLLTWTDFHWRADPLPAPTHSALSCWCDKFEMIRDVTLVPILPLAPEQLTHSTSVCFEFAHEVTWTLS